MAGKRKAAANEIAKMIKMTDFNNSAFEFVAAKAPTNYERKNAKSEEDVKAIINEVKGTKKIIRVCGSEHSVDKSIIGPGEEGILLTLTEKLASVTNVAISKCGNKLRVTVGGGCPLGVHKKWEEHPSWKGSLCQVAHENGFALPILGGISQQTVGGFMMTGSAGGSLKHGFADIIEKIEFIDGNGCKHTCQKSDGEDSLFYAVGVSMGLFGVITSVTFLLVDKAFVVTGREVNVEFENSVLASKNAFKAALDDPENEYFRLNWFPQKHCTMVMQWNGKQEPMIPEDQIKPYKSPLQCWVTAFGASFVLKYCDFLLAKKPPTEDDYKYIGGALSIFADPKNDTEFSDYWYRALPMDNEAHTDSIMKVDFTEVWVPLDQHDLVWDKLMKLYDDTEKGQQAAGSFATEIYYAKKSSFWLSMSYDQDMLRIDPYWFNGNRHGDMKTFFGYLWDTLLGIKGARLHWGKHLPEEYNLSPADLKKTYKKLEAWLALRHKMDPHQVFVNNYWRDVLEIPKMGKKA